MRLLERLLLVLVIWSLPAITISPARAEPMFMGIGDVPGGSHAYAVSADGSVVAGWSQNATID